MKPAQFPGMAEYEDYIIRMKELDKAPEPKKKISRLRSFLGGSLDKPLVVDFSRDSRSSFTDFPAFKRSTREKK